LRYDTTTPNCEEPANHHRRDERQRQATWTFVRDTLKADVVLAQETVPPADVPAVYRDGGIDDQRQWGSAVAVFNREFEPLLEVQSGWRGKLNGPVQIDASHPGAVAAARVDGITFVSAYGLNGNGYSSTSMLRIFADLEHLFDDHRGYGRHVALAGDWNLGTWWSGSDSKYRDRDASLLGLLTARGLAACIDAHLPIARGRLEGCRCTFGSGCRHVWTHRHWRWKDVPYQNDYMYASTNLMPLVKAAWVHDDPWTFSDHRALVMDLDAP
jgi:exonuclease III